MKDELNWLRMIEDRNLLVHTYTMELSRQIFEKVKVVHHSLLYDLLEAVKKELNEPGFFRIIQVSLIIVTASETFV